MVLRKKHHLLLLNILDMIAEKMRLPPVMEILKYNPYQIGKPYYTNRRLDKFCESIWQKPNWHHVIYKTSLIDPRNDPDSWLCDCSKKHLKFGYRFFSNGAKSYCIYCSICFACTSGGKIGKKRIKPTLRKEASHIVYTNGRCHYEHQKPNHL